MQSQANLESTSHFLYITYSAKSCESAPTPSPTLICPLESMESRESAIELGTLIVALEDLLFRVDTEISAMIDPTQARI